MSLDDITPFSTPKQIGSASVINGFQMMGRVLIFRATREHLRGLNNYDLAAGLLVTWLVGMGRFWDNDRAEILQKLGLGSVIYIFVLALFLRIVLLPVGNDKLRYTKLLTFISLTSLPAVLYAIPLQYFFYEPGLKTANEINLAFLGIVSVWRVALLWYYLKRAIGMGMWVSICATLLPLNMIVIVLTFLNLDRVVFDFMRGINHSNASPNDDSYMILLFITLTMHITVLPLLGAYLVAALRPSSQKSPNVGDPDEFGVPD